MSCAPPSGEVKGSGGRLKTSILDGIPGAQVGAAQADASTPLARLARPLASSWRVRRWVIARVAQDAITAAVAVVVAYWLRFSIVPVHIPGGEVPSLGYYTVASVPTAGVVVMTFALMSVYRHQRGKPFVDELLQVGAALAVSAILILAIVALYRPDGFTYSRLTFVCWLVVTAVALPTGRYLLRRLERWRHSLGRGTEPALIVGTGPSVSTLVQRLRMFADSGLRPLGILDDALEPGTEAFGLKVIGDTHQIQAAIQLLGVRVVFIALSDVSHERALELVDACRELAVDFHLVHSMLGSSRLRLRAEEISGVPVLTVRQTLVFGGRGGAVKRSFDLVSGGIMLALASPLIGLIFVLVKLTSSGPALIHQERVGRNGRTFRMHKFRSMRDNAEADSGPVWATPDDPRRTPLGRVLRRLSLDELPQLWNVIKGDMSLVGPRPERLAFVQKFTAHYPGYEDRLRLRPGLTGWAQANDIRGQTSIEERLGYDLYYIENWSLGFDVKIILTTLVRVLRHQNAH